MRYLIGRTEAECMMRWTEAAGHLGQRESSLPGQLCNQDWRVQKRATHSAHHSSGDGSSFEFEDMTPLE